ncbi:MAG: phosphoribosylglycinamide formyltransferase [Rhodospirillaceae bacterium]|nr:phosphoribosylglycinamide formyltransferase [Rhodospirillaceae bacterium]
MAQLPQCPRLAFLASHNGTNMRAIVAACRMGRLNAEPALLISNNRDCGAIAWADLQDIPWQHLSATKLGSEAAVDDAMARELKAANVDLIVLAGYMRKLGPKTLAAFSKRILNVHPALLPKFGGQGMYGKHVHEAVLKSGDKTTGVTIHIVDGEYDHGPIVAQAEVPVAVGDSPDTLAARVQAKEQELYPQVLKKIFSGEIDLDKL